MSCCELTGDLKTDREESLTKHVGFVYAYAKKAKNRKLMKKVATSRKSKNHNRQSKTRHISVCYRLIAILKSFINPYIFKLARNMNFHLKLFKKIG